MRGEERAVAAYIKRLRPHIRYFYRAALAITADRQLSEQVLTEALVRAYQRNASASPAGFRDAVLGHVRAAAFEFMEGAVPMDEWPGFAIAPDEKQPFAGLLLREDRESQRIIALRYGCGMTVREIASIMGLGDEAVKGRLTATRKRVERALKGETAPRMPYERACLRAVRYMMGLPGDDRIDGEYLLHEVQVEITGRHRPRRFIAGVIRGVLVALFASLLCAALWLVGVLVLM